MKNLKMKRIKTFLETKEAKKILCCGKQLNQVNLNGNPLGDLVDRDGTLNVL